MVILHWVGSLLAVPLRILAQGQRLLHMPNHKLLRVVWLLSGDEAAAVASLSPLLAENRTDKAMSLARQWNARRPGPMLTGFTGLLLLDAGDIPAANRTLLEGRRMTAPDPTAMLDTLEFAIAQRDEDSFSGRRCAARLEQQRDLPPALRRLILHELMLVALLDRNYEDARRRAVFLLDIQQEPLAEIVLWALAMRRGDDRAATAHLARNTLPEAATRYFQYLGAWAVELQELNHYEQALHSADETLHQKALRGIAYQESVQ